MAQKVTVALEDDLDGGPAEQTVRFGFGGTDYEIDLSAKNAAAFHKQLAPFLEHARKSGRAQSRRPGRTRPAASAAAISGPGRKTMASRSASAGASRPAWWSSTRPDGPRTLTQSPPVGGRALRLLRSLLACTRPRLP